MITCDSNRRSFIPNNIEMVLASAGELVGFLRAGRLLAIVLMQVWTLFGGSSSSSLSSSLLSLLP